MAASAAQSGHAVVIGGVEFSQGAMSFADAVTFYDPSFGGGSVLTGSGNDDDGLWIFQVGPDVEDTTVNISAASWALMIGGFALSGGALRSRMRIVLA